ncbi:protein DEFECTIVE IN EXINE FORMATION 1-like [Dendronephthya gigantea]|uniref:protein DEFECTIVE IN EXINE FORMATION 1-like n=1 Tax=Dendronephthya gigantea TaxID=151771 RepID=UPI00106A8180|nr:protein DEFECTIVE IN EXINE FORMATION 1-like [Dendronephthya gigantea]
MSLMPASVKLFLFFSQILQYSFAKTCHKELKLNWTISVSNSAVISQPLLAKLNNANEYDIIVSTLDGSVSVIDANTGQEGPQWPVYLPEESFYAGPLLYDIDQDGSFDILLSTASGNILFVSQNGTIMTSHTILLPRLMVKRRWYIVNIDNQSDISPEKNTIFVTTDDYNRHTTHFAESFVTLDSHILSTPVIGDFTGDGINSDLIIPVNYYFDNEVKFDEQHLENLKLDVSEVDFYLSNGIIVIDLRTREIIYNTTLELTMKSSSLPCYLLSSPVVVDLDGNHGSNEVVIGSSSGKVHVLNKDGGYPWSFHLSDSIAGQIAVEDINNDGSMEVIVVDGSANVMCYNQDKLLWEATISGTLTAGAQLYDINNDDKLEVIIASNDGYIWVLDCETGKVLENWPVLLGSKIHSQVLFQKQIDDSIDMIVMSAGNLIILSGNTQCLEVIPTEEISYTPVIYHEQNMALIVSTSDGAILSFNQAGVNKQMTRDEFRIKFTETTSKLQTVASQNFNIEFEIFTQSYKEPSSEFNVVISYSTERGIKHDISKYSKPGLYSRSLQSPKVPKYTYISIVLCNKFKQCSEDRIFINFHSQTKDTMVLYAFLPLLVMAVLLLFIHGYPEGDLLPTWESSKKY